MTPPPPERRDPDPARRRRLLEVMAGSALPEADEFLVQGLLDPADAVAVRAVDLLAARHPWLALNPVRWETLPLARGLRYRFGPAWGRVFNALSQTLRDPAGGPFPLKRLIRLPGLLPDLAQALDESGRTAEAARARRFWNGERAHGGAARQILVAPTYACNLNCAYCYVKTWTRRFPRPMTLAAFRTVMRWSRGQGLDWVILGGGEPTVHPDFGGLVREARRHGMKVSLTSNGLFGESVLRQLRPEAVPEFICHVDQDALRDDPGRRAAWSRNIGCARAAGVDVRIRYTLTARSDSRERRAILELARTHGVPMVHFGFAFRNVDGNNEFYAHDTGRARAFDEAYNAFMDEAAAAGVALHLSKPFPLCRVTLRTLRRAAAEGGLRPACTAWGRGYSMNLTVNPDLTTLPCNALRLPGPSLTSFRTVREAGRFHADALRRLYDVPWRPACARCVLHHRGLCQGACLAERGNGEGA